MFGLVTGLVKGVVDVVDDVATEVDDALFGESTPKAIKDYKMLRTQGFSHKSAIEIVSRWHG